MKLLTVTEVAALLRCSPRTIYDRVKAKQIPYRKDGHRLLFVESEVLAHIEQLPGVRLVTQQSGPPEPAIETPPTQRNRFHIKEPVLRAQRPARPFRLQA